MPNCMLTPLIIERQFLLALPSDAVTSAVETVNNDILVKFWTSGREGQVLVGRLDRIRSLDDVMERYKPSIHASLCQIWAEIAPLGEPPVAPRSQLA